MEEQTLLFECLTQPRSGLWIKINKKNSKIIYIQKLLYVFNDIQSILLMFSKNMIYVVENVLATLCVNCYDLYRITLLKLTKRCIYICRPVYLCHAQHYDCCRLIANLSDKGQLVAWWIHAEGTCVTSLVCSHTVYTCVCPCVSTNKKSNQVAAGPVFVKSSRHNWRR